MVGSSTSTLGGAPASNPSTSIDTAAHPHAQLAGTGSNEGTCPRCRQWLAHPGELAVAEAFAADVQRDAVPQGLVDRVIVAVTVHTDEATFLYNQPTIDPLPGASS